MSSTLPQRVLSWYGDDFTGSTDVLEALATAAIDAVLFLKVPSDSTFDRFRSFRAFGLAGSSRSQSPDWMDIHLTNALEWLRTLGTPLCHYKVCSTFDSSPETGSIGRALEIGKRVFQSQWVPMIVGAPRLRRFTAFGNLFAESGGTVYRIDRHPAMSCHPVTPMHEADLRVHLAAQTNSRIELLSLLDSTPQHLQAKLSQSPDAILIDVLDESSLQRAGRIAWESRQPFIVGSSGVESSLASWWRAAGEIGDPHTPPKVDPTDRLVVLSGSCSPATERQIRCAAANGFDLVRLDVSAIVNGDGAEAAVDQSLKQAICSLASGHSVVVYTASESSDRLALTGSTSEQAALREKIAESAGRALVRVLDASRVRRAVVAGGDTSSLAGQQLAVDALTFIAPLAPGAPLCRAWSHQPDRDGLEIVFKGGQMGGDNFFSEVRQGRVT